MPTMKDVARLAGVSVATVSTTLSGASYVSPELKARVHEAIEALGYAQNAMASGLKRGATRLLGLVVPDITNPFFTALAHAVQVRAQAAGYAVLLASSEQEIAQERTSLRLMRSHQAAGTILCPIGDEEAYRDLARDLGPMPAVAVDHATDTMALDAVLLDNRTAARLATAHILEYGHRDVAAIVGPQHLLPGRERLAGFTAALDEAGIATDPALIRAGSFREEDAHDACLDLLRAPGRPTAIFVANNHMLVGVMRALAVAGASCPDDVSIASIDDFPWAAAFAPALTTVRQPVDAMAEAALGLLLGRIGGAEGPPTRVRLDPALVVRASCALPPRRPLRVQAL